MIVMILVTIKLEIDSIYYAYNTENSANLIYDEIHEIMTNIDSVITSNTKEEELKQVNEAKEKTYDLACISNLNTNNTTYGLQAISIVAIFGINYLAYRLYVQHLIDDATLTSTVLLSLLFMDYYNYSIQGIKNLINSMGRYNEMREYFQEFKIITQPKAVLDRQITLKVTNGNIIIKNLTVRYENNVIFDNLNLKIKGHSVTGLLGPIGSGKTTILKMLAGIITYKGDILIDDQELENCTYESIVDNIAYISQHPKLFNRTVLYNINYGSALSKDQIMSKLKELGLLQFIDSFKQGLNYVVGKEGSNVSGGQRQFIALIRALIQNKSILLLDEPSSSLDKKNKALFINLIRSIKDKTIIISTHDSLIMPLFNESIDMEKVKSAPHLSRSKSQSHRQKPRIDIL
jgi:ABC-type multidrug transport system fused ATPase/permease subunit